MGATLSEMAGALPAPDRAAPVCAAEPRADRARLRADLVGLLFARHRRMLLWHVGRFLPSRDDAEEVVQEACLRLLRSERLDVDVRRARNYLFKTATNLARDSWRRLHTQRAAAHDVGEAGGDAHAPSPEGLVDGERGMRIANDALRELLPRARRAFLLHWHAEMSYAEIALELGVSKKTVERDVSLAAALCRCRLAAWRTE